MPTLEKKALQLDRRPVERRRAPPGRTVYGWHIARGPRRYLPHLLHQCASAQKREIPTQQIVQLPEALAVGADYGLTVINGASVSAHRFALFILSVEGQRTLAKHGFAAPALPQ